MVFRKCEPRREPPQPEEVPAPQWAAAESEEAPSVVAPVERPLGNWAWLVRRLLRLRFKRRLWHHLGEHLKNFTALKSITRRGHGGAR